MKMNYTQTPAMQMGTSIFWSQANFATATTARERMGELPPSTSSQEQGDVWPGDLLTIAATSTGLNANLVVRSVEIELLSTVPGLAKYTVSFANDWADALSIKASPSVPADVWLQQPQTTPPLANLASLSVTAVTGSAIQVSANATPPPNGGFEVRRRGWAFGPGTNSACSAQSGG